MNEYHRGWLYAVATAGVLGFSWWLQAGEMEADAFSLALSWLLAAGVLLLGGGIFLRRGSDALFLDCLGGVTLAAALILFLLYGGMESVTDPGAALGANMLLCLWTALPLAFVMRTLALGFSAGASRGRHHPVAWVAVGLFLALLVLICTGEMLSFVNMKPLT